MGYLIDGYKIMGKEISDYAVRHRAGIGTAVSIGGTIVSNILSTRAGAKSARMIDAKEVELGRELTKTEKLKLCWSNHIGSAATAAASCVGASYSHNQHVKDFNKVATAYAGVKKLYDSAQKATKEVLGEKKSIELQDKVNKKYIEENPELKKKILETNENPEPGVKRKFLEPVMGEIIYDTLDNIEMRIQMMKYEMNAMEPRDISSFSGFRTPHGVHLRRFYELGKQELPKNKELSEVYANYGWNKGKEKDGSDDDEIGAYFTPMILDEETMETCVVINWDMKPSDMRLGDYLKS